MTDTAEQTEVALITERQMQKLIVLCSQAGMRSREEAITWINGVLGTALTSRKELTKDQASEIIDRLEDGQARLKELPGSTGEAATVQEAIRRVMVDISRIGVGKLGTNREQNYKFRGIDDIVNAMSPLLARHGVVIVPWVQKVKTDYRQTKSGGTMMFAMITVDYEIIGPLGDSFRSRIVGLGSDTSDKATNKALSGAFKYLLGQVFAIPQVGFDDGDETSPAMIEPRGRERTRDTAQQNTSLPANPNQDLLDKITLYASEAGTDATRFTAKFRAAHSNVSMDEMAQAPRGILEGFVRQVEAYRQQQQAEEAERRFQEEAGAEA